MNKTGLIMAIAAIGLCGLLVAAGVQKGENMLNTVDKVDLNRYLGKWYEIAKYPNWFEKNLAGVTATYSLRNDGKIKVLNAGRKNSLDGKIKSATGKAWVVDTNTNAKLKVQFFWPFSGDYWIIELGKDYDYAVIGEPSRKYLWILCRSSKMDAALYQGILTRLEKYGYDSNKLELNPQQ